MSHVAENQLRTCCTCVTVAILSDSDCLHLTEKLQTIRRISNTPESGQYSNVVEFEFELCGDL